MNKKEQIEDLKKKGFLDDETAKRSDELLEKLKEDFNNVADMVEKKMDSLFDQD